jgi:hypothetical protein
MWAMFSTRMAQECRLPARYPLLLHPPHPATVSWLVYRCPIIPFYHVISPSSHVWKGRPVSVGDSRAVCCSPLVSQMGRKSPSRSGLSKLYFDSSLRPLRARDLLVATVAQVFSWGCCNELFYLALNCYLFGFASAPYSVTVMAT